MAGCPPARPPVCLTHLASSPSPPPCPTPAPRQDLAALAESFAVKRRAGTAKAHASGFGGSGFKFNKAEEDQVKAVKKVGK
jgi:hypothetical protein